MNYLADIGSIIEVTPGDDIWIRTSEHYIEYVDDRSPFRFKVSGHLMDGQIFYGLYGPIVSGHDRYRGLTCNVMIRIDGTDWRKEHYSGANFRVGSGIVERDHQHDFRHPDGTRLGGLPEIGCYGHIETINAEQAS